MPVNQIVINGQKNIFEPLTSLSTPNIELRESFTLENAIRGVSQRHAVTLGEKDVIELIFDDDTVWLCSSETIEEVFPEAMIETRDASNAFVVPQVLIGNGGDRSIAGNILLKVINIFSKKGVEGKVESLAADLEKKQLENQIGLLSVTESFRLVPYQAREISGPVLLFLHGTASSTVGSFGGLANTNVWTGICLTYKNNILAFQHESLTKSPLENVLALVNQLPASVDLHLVSHSRGGLIGDILSRFATTDENNYGFDENEKAYLKKAGRDGDLKQIADITALLKNKKIKVSKFVRVACPASGTVLASDRLDNFFNILFNTVGYSTGLAANPVHMLFKNLIAEILHSKNDVNVLPGLEAMNPESPFIKILNNQQSKVVTDGRLFVISGNSHARINLKALIILASKLFYRQDNDLVVNTPSMYRGSRRTDPGLYYFDETTETDHFHYFTNSVTQLSISKALSAADKEIPDGFKPIVLNEEGKLERNALLNLEGGQLFTETITGNKPILVLLPGIMGSNLEFDGSLLWINYLKFLAGDLVELDIENTSHITAPSLIKTSYQQFVNYFSSKYDVVTFAFDWRLQLKDSAKLFEKKIKGLLEYNQPIKIVGHSMGGVLVRDFIVACNDTWQILNKSPGFKLIFLGAPLGGSLRIPAVLFGQDAIIKKLAKLDIFHTRQELVAVFSKLPGILSLLPLTVEGIYDFSDIDVWRKMAAATNTEWPLPTMENLKVFKTYRDENLGAAADIDYTNMIYIAGQDAATPCDYKITSNNGLVFLNTAEGDASVTWASGIPIKMILDDTVYYVNVTHGALANEPAMFKGIEDLLERGVTNLLSKKRPVVRSQEKLFRSPMIDDFDISPYGIEKTLLGLGAGSGYATPSKPIHVLISNGDLRYASYPILAGHFNKDGILQAEREIDKSMGGALSNRHRMLLYPGEIGTSEIIISDNADLRGAIIVGLGDYGTLTGFLLTKTVEQAITKYLLTVSNSSPYTDLKISKAPAELGISALMIGCDYGGLSVEGSIRAIIQGVRNANNKIMNLLENDARTIDIVEFVELYRDRAQSGFYSLKRIAAEKVQGDEIVLARNEVKIIFGANARVAQDSSNVWWTRITVCEEINATSYVEKARGVAPVIKHLEFSVSTGAAREETKQLFTTKAIIDKFIEDISVNQKWTPELSTTLFELIVPNDFKEHIKKQNNINWIVDKYTAALPWELLHDKSVGVKPICVNAGMIRQLKTDASRQKINAVIQDTALVVADPNLNGFITQLPGALKEGEVVSAILKNEGFDTLKMLSESPFNIIHSLFNGSYKIIHLSGHGAFDESIPESSGMVIGENVFLSTREICQMSTVPEFVFVNCCHLGKIDGIAEELYKNRYKLAANIGTQLIEIGVKAVIVAGWQVGDAAALLFSEKFYDAMFANNIFGDAVRKARECVYNQFSTQNNTWGAYQCYGDPFYKFRNTNETGKAVAFSFSIAIEAEIQLFNLKNELETSKYSTEEYLARLQAISRAVEVAGIRNALITEYEALIYAGIGDYQTALFVFDKLFRIEKAEFTVSTLEKYFNIKAKHIAYTYIDFRRKGAVNRSKRNDLVKDLNEVIKNLENLISIGATAERYSILGSAYKRLGLIGAAGDKEKAFEAAAEKYKKADGLSGNSYSAYTLNNWLEMLAVLIMAGKAKWGEPLNSSVLPTITEARKLLKSKLMEKANAYDSMDFWNEMSKANIRLCLLIIDGDANFDGGSWEQQLIAFKNVWAKAGSKENKIAEIEHLEILLDGMCMSKNSPKVISELEKLKNALYMVI